MVLFAWFYVQPFWYSASLWQTDRWVDKQTDTHDDSKYSASTASCGQKCYSCGHSGNTRNVTLRSCQSSALRQRILLHQQIKNVEQDTCYILLVKHFNNNDSHFTGTIWCLQTRFCTYWFYSQIIKIYKMYNIYRKIKSLNNNCFKNC